MQLTACDRADLAALFCPCPPLVWACAVRQLELGPCFAVRDADRTLMTGGFVPMPDYWEAWWHVAPIAAPLLLPALRLVRLTFAALPQADPRPVETAVRTRAGARVARALGFHRVGTAGNIEVWRRAIWENS